MIKWFKKKIIHLAALDHCCNMRSFDGKEFACNVGNLGSIPGSGRSPGEGTGNPLQYSCLEHPMDRGAWAGLLFMESQKVEKNSTNTLTWWRVFSFGMPSLAATFGIWFPDQGLNLGHLHCLEEGMVAHSSILAWRIPKDLGFLGARWAAVHRVAKSQTQLSN